MKRIDQWTQRVLVTMVFAGIILALWAWVLSSEEMDKNHHHVVVFRSAEN